MVFQPADLQRKELPLVISVIIQTSFSCTS